MTDDLPEVEIIVRGGHPDFLDLPWETPLAEWDHERIVPMAHGISRHVVRFVRYEHRVYAIKETEAPRAEAEHRVLRLLREDHLKGIHLRTNLLKVRVLVLEREPVRIPVPLKPHNRVSGAGSETERKGCVHDTIISGLSAHVNNNLDIIKLFSPRT